jgi:PilZ domain
MTEDRSRERRRFHRVAHDAQGTLFASRADWPCRVQDLSLQGCLLASAVPWRLKPGPTYQLSIWLARDVQLNMNVALVHQSGELAGFSFLALDLDSATALRRLVELNLGDGRLLERDLKALIRAPGEAG